MLPRQYVCRGAPLACKQGATSIGARVVGTGLARHASGAARLHRFLAAPPQGSAGPEGIPSTASTEPAASAAVSSTEPEEAGEGFWSPDDIRELVRRQEEAEERMRGEELTWDFKADPEGLYDYVDRAYAEGPRRVTTPLALMAEDVTGESTLAYPPAVANDIVGTGSWRLKHMFDPVIEFMVSRIEGCWREVLDTDLNLYPRDQWKARGWDLLDSEDPRRELDGFSYADIPDPQPGADGYPRLQIENRMYCSKVFRKLHVEVGVRQGGMQVLHVVVYPRYSYDLPIFGLDMVLVGDRVSLAVADCCPVRRDLKLPAHYMETMALLQKTFFEDLDPASRRIPDWGAACFSPLAVCLSPTTPEALAAFAKYAVALHRAHLIMSLNAAPVVAGPGDQRAAARLQELLEGQKRFCDNQLANKKTRRVLEAAFGQEWTEEYMSKLMFDFDPSYEPPYLDASYERLYTYFDENPEFGEMADEAYEMELDAQADRAAETVEKVATGAPVPREKLSMAMQFLYQNDPTFRAAIQTIRGGEQEVPPEEFLTEEFLGLLQKAPDNAGKKASQGART